MKYKITVELEQKEGEKDVYFAYAEDSAGNHAGVEMGSTAEEAQEKLLNTLRTKKEVVKTFEIEVL
jgi:hypothetical protein